MDATWRQFSSLDGGLQRWGLGRDRVRSLQVTRPQAYALWAAEGCFYAWPPVPSLRMIAHAGPSRTEAFVKLTLSGNAFGDCLSERASIDIAQFRRPPPRLEGV
jgi:hypothetical protein